MLRPRYANAVIATAFDSLFVERATGIEPALEAWEAPVLPLNYARSAIALYSNLIRFIDHSKESLQGWCGQG